MVLIAISGWGEDRDKQQAQEAGFNRSLVKPVSLKALEILFDALRASA